jgi:hypothetical protein
MILCFFLIYHKSEALSCFIKFINPVKNQLDMKIKTLRTNQGHECLFDHFRKLFNERGIERTQQNSIAERRSRTLLEIVRSMMEQVNLSIIY